MKIKIILTMITMMVLITSFLLILKLNIPLNYKEAEISPEAQSYVMELQKKTQLEPDQCAVKYLFYQTDYHDQVPDRIKVTVKKIGQEKVMVIIDDPSCQDDSVYSSRDRIYLIHENHIWKPVQHEWSHRGRGRIGWTTEPTS